MKYARNTLTIIFLLILIVIIPIQVNHELYRLGWEMPKVRMLQWTAVWIILSSTIYWLSTQIIKNIKLISSNDNPEISKSQNPISKQFKNSNIKIEKQTTYNLKRITYNFSFLFSFIFFLLSLIAISISSLSSDLKAPVFALPNALYEKVFYWLPQNQAVLGSYFREQGLITIILIILSALILSWILNKKLIVLTLFLFTLSGFIHSIEAIRQVIEIYKLNPDLIKEGRWVFGFFGQANFFSGHLILCFISSLYLYRLLFENRKFLKNEVKLFLAKLPGRKSYYVLRITKLLPDFLLLFTRTTTLLSALMIYFSYSTWGWFLLVLLVILCFRSLILETTTKLSRKILSTKKQIRNKSELSNTENQNNFNFFNYFHHFNKINIISFTAIISFLFIMFMPLAMRIIPNYLPSQAARTDFWEEISYIYITKPLKGEAPITQLLFGTGFDTLGETYHANGKFLDRYVDRAHNLYFDILAFTGVIGLTIFSLFTLFTFIHLHKSYRESHNNHIIVEFTSIALCILLIRATYHTHSIVNLLNLAIIYAIAWSLKVKDKN